MTRGLYRIRCRGDHASRDLERKSPWPPSGGRATNVQRKLLMQWETPTAQDFRFGFEITMYVAAR